LYASADRRRGLEEVLAPATVPLCLSVNVWWELHLACSERKETEGNKGRRKTGNPTETKKKETGKRGEIGKKDVWDEEMEINKGEEGKEIERK
jgi:hypothetical protein